MSDFVTEAYLDNSATTPVCKESVEAVYDSVKNSWGNPSSLHKVGMNALIKQRTARENIAQKLYCQSSEVYFTAGGTDGSNIALFGAAHRNSRNGKRIVTTEIEHPSVKEVCKALGNEGFEVIYLPVDNCGKIKTEDLYAAINKETCLVSIMHVNNEVGSIQPIDSIRGAVRASGSKAIVHCDAVQSFGKLVTKVSAMGVDIMTISSHKIHGPKGAGALYIKKGTKLQPHILGGGQENKIRPGTEPMPAICGFGAAAAALPNLQKQLDATAKLRDYLAFKLRELDGVIINSPDDACPYIINFSVLGVPSQTMIRLLSDMGIYISGGSACAKGHRSYVLTAMGISPDRIDSALRVSFSRYNTKEHIDMLIDGIKIGKNRISR